MIAPTRPLSGAFSRDGLWEGRTIGSFLDECREQHRGRVSVVDRDVTLTYGELGRRVDAVAAGLRGVGVRAGDVVLVQLPNWWEAVVVFHAILQVGAIVNPVVPIYRSKELRFILDQARPRAVVTAERFRNFDHGAMFGELIGELPADDRPALVTVRGDAGDGAAIDVASFMSGDPAEGGDTQSARAASAIALLMYTSGTTASPKGVLHSHETLVYECRSIASLFALKDDDSIFMASPLTHITGFLYGFILPAMLGTSVVLLDVWEPGEAIEAMELAGCRFTVAATPFLQGLTEEHTRRQTRSSLHTFACGGADVPPELVRLATEVLGSNVCRIYGSTEFPTFSCARPGDTLAQKAETDGLPIGPVTGRIDTGIDAAIDGVGELLVAGPELFHGYLDPELNADAFTDDGYFRTGDLASFDGDGFVRIHGRQKDIIIRKGENISARELEDILITHPAIADVAVVAVPDPVSGERACAVVVPRAGREIDLAAIVSHLATAGIAKQKYPEQLAVVEELPRTASGKVQKFVLRQQLAGARQGAS